MTSAAASSSVATMQPGAAPSKTIELASGLASVMQRALGELPSQSIGRPSDLSTTRTVSIADATDSKKAANSTTSPPVSLTDSVFNRLDLNGDGVISRDEFKKADWISVPSFGATVGAPRAPFAASPALRLGSAPETMDQIRWPAPSTSLGTASGVAAPPSKNNDIAIGAFDANYLTNPVQAAGGIGCIRPPCNQWDAVAPGVGSSAPSKSMSASLGAAALPGGTSSMWQPPPVAAHLPNQSVDITSAPWSQSPRRPTIGDSGTDVAPLAAGIGVGGSDDGSERRRVEIASLRREIGTLLRVNRQLHDDLSQLNMAPTSLMGSVVSDVRAAADVTASIGSRAEDRERRVLEDRVRRLTQSCQTLEEERNKLRQTLSESVENQNDSTSAVATLLRERDDLRQQTLAAELSRQAAEQRLATAEGALSRTLEEMDGKQRQLASGCLDHARLGHWLAKEVDILRKELCDAESRLGETTLALEKKTEQLERNEKEYSEFKIEYDALVVANDNLRKEIVNTKDRTEAEQRGFNSAEAELAELKAQLGLRKFDYTTELDDAKNRGEALEVSLQECRESLHLSEASMAAYNSEEAELQGELKELHQQHSELELRVEWSREDHESETAQLEASISKLGSEKGELEKQLEAKMATKNDYNLRRERCAYECDYASQELVAERSRTSEAFSRSQSEIAEAEHQVESLLRQLQDQRQHNADIWREISIARGAAGDAARAPWAIAEDRAASRPKSWASSALQMHREIEQLRQWKGETTSVLQQLQANLGMSQGKYKRQLEHNQKLQEQLEQMGRQARAAAGGPAMGAAADSSTMVPTALLSSGTFLPDTAGTTPAFDTTRLSAPPNQANGFACGAALPPSTAAACPAAMFGFDRPNISYPNSPLTPVRTSTLSGLPTGPDVPEQPDLPMNRRSVQKSHPAAWDSPEEAVPLRTMGSLHGRMGGRSSLYAPGPLDGPFYEAYKSRQDFSPARRFSGPSRKPQRSNSRGASISRARAASASGARRK